MAKKPTYQELEQRVQKLEEEIAKFKWFEEKNKATSSALMNTFDDVFGLVDTEGIMIDANEALAQRFGLSVDDLKGMNCWDLVPQEMLISRKSYFAEVIKSGEPVRFEDKSKGTWFDNVFYPVFDEQGKITGLALLGRDITERKRTEALLKESEEKFRLLTEQNLLGVIIVQGGFVKYVNQAASDLTEYSIKEALNWGINGFGRLFHPDDLAFVMEQVQKKQEGVEDVVTHYSYRIITKSGKVKWVDQFC